MRKATDLEIEALVRELAGLYAHGARGVRERLLRSERDAARFEELGDELRTATGRPVGWTCGFDALRSRRAAEPIGDPSCTYRVLLSPALDDPRDWDERLLRSAGGSIDLCRVWVSALGPWYALDVHRMAYSERTDVWTFREMKRGGGTGVVRAAEKVLAANGLRRLAEHAHSAIVPSAATDCVGAGRATVFDCLFSDVDRPVRGVTRYVGSPIAGVVPGCRVSWRETVDGKGSPPRRTREVCVYTASRTTLWFVVDGAGRVSELQVLQAGDTRPTHEWRSAATSSRSDAR